jgi:hypothetical protein
MLGDCTGGKLCRHSFRIQATAGIPCRKTVHTKNTPLFSERGLNEELEFLLLFFGDAAADGANRTAFAVGLAAFMFVIVIMNARCFLGA